MGVLKRISTIPLPKHTDGGFDHADVHLDTGRVFVAHTANGTIEIIDGERLQHMGTIQECPEASGILCAQREELVFAAARATGRILKIDARSLDVTNKFLAGARPNGLAWDSQRKRLLVADVADFNARIIDPDSGNIVVTVKLSGGPRWCVYDVARDQFLINVKDPPRLDVVSAESGVQAASIPISAAGPHGLQHDGGGRVYIACDAASLIELSLNDAKESRKIQISGPPDVLWYNSKLHELYCAIGRPGVIDVIDTGRMEKIDRVETEEGAHTLTFDNRRQRLYSFFPKKNCAEVYQET